MAEFEPLSNNEVLYVDRGRVLISNPTFKVSEFLDALAQLVSEREDDWSDDTEGWFSDGLDCEVLRFSNQGWQRGRVRLRLEFCPDPAPKLLQESKRSRNDDDLDDYLNDNRLEGEVRSRENPRLRDEPRPRPVREDIYSRQDDFYLDDPRKETFEEDY
jgi:KGK domain